MLKNVFYLALIVAFASCKKQSEDAPTDTIADYAPLKVGKYISYKLDSTVFTNLGTVQVVRSYQVRYTVLDSVVNSGKVSYRIVRSIRADATQPYINDNTFTANYNGNSFEFVDNNLRFIKLVLPYTATTTWKGNSYINTSSSSSPQYLFDWDYTYENVGSPKQYGTTTFDNTITIKQRDESVNTPVTASTIIATKDFSEEIYAKGVGMIYKDFIHWEYQKNSGTGFYTGYGIKLTYLDRN
jgi:hypothetical protein